MQFKSQALVLPATFPSPWRSPLLSRLDSSALGNYMSTMIDQLPLDHLNALRKHPKVLTVATLCSGTDIAIHALAYLKNLLRETLGTSFEVKYLFGCEKNDATRAWALANAPIQPSYYFGDVDHLGRSTVDGGPSSR